VQNRPISLPASIRGLPASFAEYFASTRFNKDGEDQGPSQNAIDALAQAYNNLPQYQPLALAQARQDLRDGRSDRAVAELKPIAYSPHGEKYAQKMRAWIQEIEAKKAPQLADATAEESSDDK
jgi:hypothetical protein